MIYRLWLDGAHWGKRNEPIPSPMGRAPHSGGWGPEHLGLNNNNFLFIPLFFLDITLIYLYSTPLLFVVKIHNLSIK